MFKGVTRVNKEEGRGETESLPSIEPEDFDKLSAYFKTAMSGPPNPTVLQEIVILNLIYYLHGMKGQRELKKYD